MQAGPNTSEFLQEIAEEAEKCRMELDLCLLCFLL
jgi:hypothetical protein